MPLTHKGDEIMRHMDREYGDKRAKGVFYASRNAGTIDGVERHPRAHGGADISAIEEALHLSRKPHIPPVESVRHPGINFPGGLIDAPVHGRTDKIPLNVPSGSYVIPADIVSALGQGNTSAGAEVIQEIVSGQPYDASSGAYGSGQAKLEHGRGAGFVPTMPSPPPNSERLGEVQGPEPPHMKKGGKSLVPIIAAGGEYVLSPKEVEYIGKGDLGRGHKLLDSWVKDVRAMHVKTLKSLPGPRK